jgi:hypothetical protein
VIGGPAAGLLALNFDISGLLTADTNGPSAFANTATAAVELFVNTNTNPANVLSLNGHTQNGVNGELPPVNLGLPATWSTRIPYNASTANMLLNMRVDVGTSDACSGLCTELAAGSFGHTFVLTNIQVLTLAGALVPNAFVVGQSGITYNNTAPGPTAVPEPASVLLVGLGSLGVVVLRRRRA